MLTFLRMPLAIARMLRHLLIAVFDALLGRRHRRYEGRVVISAPRSIVWQLMTARRCKVDGLQPMEVISEPLSGGEDLIITRVLMGGKQVSATVLRRLEEDEAAGVTRMEIIPHPLRSRPMSGHEHFGGTALRDVPGGVELTIYNELIVDRFAARVLIPLGLQANAGRLKTRCEGGSAPQSVLRRYADKGALSIAAVLSFAYLMGWREALLVTAIILLHELGHAAAMWMTGAGVGSISLIPFLGGVAVAKRPSGSQAQQAFIALMGPGFSLIPTLGLLGLFYSTDNVYWLHAAALFAIINGLNLLPIFPLDGGQILNAFFASLNPRLASGGRWAGIAIGFGAAAYFIQSVVLCLFFGLMAVQLMVTSGLAPQLRRLTLAGGAALLLAFLATLGVYTASGFYALRMEQALSDSGGEAAASAASRRRPDFSCRIPEGTEAALRRYLDVHRYAEGGFSFTKLAIVQRAGHGDLLRAWLTPPPDREKSQGVWALWRYPDWLALAQTRTVDDIAAEIASFPAETRAELATRVFIPATAAFGRHEEAAALAVRLRHAGEQVIPSAVRRLMEAGAYPQAERLLPLAPPRHRAQLALHLATHLSAGRTGHSEEQRASLLDGLGVIASAPGEHRLNQAGLIEYLAAAGRPDTPLPASFFSPSDDPGVTGAELRAVAARAVFRNAGGGDAEVRLAQENFDKSRKGGAAASEFWSYYEALAQYQRALTLGRQDEAAHILKTRLSKAPDQPESDSDLELEERVAELEPVRTGAGRIAMLEAQIEANGADAGLRQLWNLLLVEPDVAQAVARLNLAGEYVKQGGKQRSPALIEAAAADMCGISRGASLTVIANQWQWFWWRVYVINAVAGERLPPDVFREW